MSHEGSAEPVTNDGPGFHSNIPVSKLTDRITRAIEATNVSSAPSIVKTTDGVMHETRPTPTEPNGPQVARHRLGKSTDRVGRGRDPHG